MKYFCLIETDLHLLFSRNVVQHSHQHRRAGGIITPSCCAHHVRSLAMDIVHLGTTSTQCEVFMGRLARKGSYAFRNLYEPILMPLEVVICIRIDNL